MAVVKIVEGEYSNRDAVKNAINYITANNGRNKDDVYALGGYGVNYENAESVIEQFQTVKRIWNKEDKRQLVHIVVSFGDGMEKLLSLSDINVIASLTGEYLSKNEYQIEWAIHTNTDNVHVHYIINSVSYKTGRKYRLEPDEIFQIQKTVNAIANMVIYMLFTSRRCY